MQSLRDKSKEDLIQHHCTRITAQLECHLAIWTISAPDLMGIESDKIGYGLAIVFIRHLLFFLVYSFYIADSSREKNWLRN